MELATASAYEPVLIECDARKDEEGMMCTGLDGEAPVGTAVGAEGAAGTGFPARDAAAASTSPAAVASLYLCTACMCTSNGVF